MRRKSRVPPPPKYPKKPHASGQARIKYQGRTRYLGVHNSPESICAFETLLAEWREQFGKGKDASEPAVGFTVADLCAAFMKHAERHYRHADGTPTTEIESFKQSMRPLLRLYGDAVAAEFGPKALKDVRAAMISGSWLTAKERMARAPHMLVWSRKLVNQRVGRLKRIWKWGASEELVPAATFHALATVQGLLVGRTEAPDYDDVEPVSESVVQATLPFLSPVVRAMVEVQRLTGMRPGEICSLTPGEIDREGLKVDGVTLWVYRPKLHKTSWRGHAKAVVIGPKAQAALLPFLDRNPDAPCFSPREGDPRKAHRAAMRYKVAVYGHRITVACKRAGVEHWHPHQLRHATATAIGNLEQARAVLGHRDVKITSVYAARDLQTAAAIIAKIG